MKFLPLLVLCLCLPLCYGCKNEKRIEAKEQMLEVVFWLMRDTQVQAPSKYDSITISYERCIVLLEPDDHERINQLQSVLSGSTQTSTVENVPLLKSPKSRGILELESSGYKYTVKFTSSGRDLSFEIVIPGDGVSLVTLPGIAPDFETLVKSWCEET